MSKQEERWSLLSAVGMPRAPVISKLAGHFAYKVIAFAQRASKHFTLPMTAQQTPTPGESQTSTEQKTTSTQGKQSNIAGRTGTPEALAVSLGGDPSDTAKTTQHNPSAGENATALTTFTLGEQCNIAGRTGTPKASAASTGGDPSDTARATSNPSARENATAVNTASIEEAAIKEWQEKTTHTGQAVQHCRQARHIRVSITGAKHS